MDPESVPEPEAPEPSSVTTIADGIVRQLDPRYVEMERVSGWITTAVITVISMVGLTILVFSSSAPPWFYGLLFGIAFVFLAFLAWWSQRWPALEYRFASYRVDAEGLEIRRGVYFRSVTTVPRSRIQHTDVSQGPLQRRFGLGTLSVHTAGSEAAEVDLPGLPYERALEIRDHLLPRQAEDAV